MTFNNANDFGANLPLPKSFEQACALVKKISYNDIEDEIVVDHLETSARMLQSVYSAQWQGRELSPADQVELGILTVARPASDIARGQGFGLSFEERRSVELHAMALAEDWLRSAGFDTKDTSATMPYDFAATRNGTVFYVEVKGTTSDVAGAIAMTHREVELHRREKGKTALVIVSGIRLTKGTPVPVASGGEVEALVGWDIDEWELQATAFRLARHKSF
jgi:hypothetical protein